MYRRLPLCAVLLVAGCTLSVFAQDTVVRYPRAYGINYDPIIESNASRRLHEVGGWNDPEVLNAQYSQEYVNISHGLLRFRMGTEITIDEFPIKTDGFRYDDASYLASLACWCDWHSPDNQDYKAVARSFDLARRVDFGEIDQVFMQGCPYFGFWETNMHGYGGYWCNSSPLQRVACSRIYVVMGFNCERGVPEMIHDDGHRTESIMSRVYGYWDIDARRTLWDRFTANYGQTPGTYWGIGSCHYPFNGIADYEYAASRSVDTDAPLWLTMDPEDPDDFPDLTGAPVSANCEAWGGPDYHLGYMRYFFEHLPHFPDRNTLDGYDRLNNWWEYVFNFNEWPESGGDHVPGGDPPPATLLGEPINVVSTGTGDDWRPDVNAAGRVVWAGQENGTLHIFSANLDGTSRVRLSPGSVANEFPQINAYGQVVWQSFDGRDYEIYTANADGTDVVRITNNSVQDMHPDISDTGRIVWDSFDGEDYEIMSCNVDGTDLTQITNNTHAGVGKPRDDYWPRINSSDRVVWMGYDGGNWEIYGANATGGTVTLISSNSYENEYPEIGNNGQVVWHAWHTSSNAEIYVANATTGGQTRITSNSVMDWWPRINDAGEIVWMMRDGNDWEIMYRSVGGAVSAITNNLQHDQYPVIDNDGRIVWMGFDGNDWEIYEDVGGIIYQVTDNDYDDKAPCPATNGYIAWHGEIDDSSIGRTTDILSLGVLPDVTPPAIQAINVDPTVPNAVEVVFTELLDSATANAAENYAVDNGVSVLSAVLRPDGQTVLLTTSTLTFGTTYTLTVNNVTDQAVPANVIPADTQAAFYFGQALRVTDGLVAVYPFTDGSGTTVSDDSGFGTALNLTINNAAAVTWQPNALTVNDSVLISSAAGATKIIDACQASDALTLEVWLQPLDTVQSGPASIVTCASSFARNFTLGQGDDDGNGTAYSVRLRSSDTGSNGTSFLTTTGVVNTTLQHVVVTRDAAGTLKVYVDGLVVLNTTLTGTFDTWSDSYRLGLANEMTQLQPWLGDLWLVAMYDRALTLDEVLQNRAAGAAAALPITGDCNCDGQVNFFDIDPFVAALTGFANYQNLYPDCLWLNADCNADGSVDFFDIDPFVVVLTQ